MSWILVALGGAIGAAARYGTQLFGQRFQTPFPVSIFAINIAGSAVIGLIAGAVMSSRLSLSPDVRLFLMAGVLGGFTTFSSFSLDTLMLLRAGHVGLAIVNVVGQVGLSLAAVYAGFRLAS